MYPQKVLQGIPNLKRTSNFGIFDFLVVPKCQAQLVRHLLLSQARGFSRRFQILSHPHHPLLVRLLSL